LHGDEIKEEKKKERLGSLSLIFKITRRMKYLFFCFIFSAVIAGYGQNTEYTLADSNIIRQMLKTANLYNFAKADSGLLLSEKALAIARELHFKRGEAEALHTNGEALFMLGDFPQAIKRHLEALEINRELKDKANESQTLNYIGHVYIQLGEYREALQYLMSAEKNFRGPDDFGSFSRSLIGDVYDSLHMPDSALFYQKKAYEHFSSFTHPHLRSFILRHMGNIYLEFGKNDSALMYYRAGILNCRLVNDKINMSGIQIKMADLYESVHNNDSTMYYAHEAFITAQNAISKPLVLDASNLLAALYRKAGKTDSAFFYMDISSAIKDSLYGPEKFRQLQLLMLQEQQRQQTVSQQAEQFRNKIKYIVLLSALLVFLLLAFILLRNNRRKQKANNLLKEQKAKVVQTLSELKSAQAQLIQREKMASLGELTAGIAHEIQNPLNFVNNFSEVNKELIEELQEERNKVQGTRDEKLENEILNDIKENEEKINHHGKRADAIVKGMLQHSRSTAGVKELTNINALADEYLRLAYHGLRAKDKEFNAAMETNFDESIGNVNIIPQEIGRVLLNLFNNAFYAINEKKKSGVENYEPGVLVSTKKTGDKVILTVKDNGNGIPQNIVDKIFQPFFTTKPTGVGTGLGLSMAYDIIKAHGGEMKVETKEGEGSEFIIQLPII
jgi:two-component system, NtrC family, sensor kinase